MKRRLLNIFVILSILFVFVSFNTNDTYAATANYVYGGVRYTYDSSGNFYYVSKYISGTDIVILDNVEGIEVTKIGSNAFENGTQLSSVEIPDSVISISANAFKSCSNLTSVELSDDLTSIGNSAFSGCTSLTSIEIPESVISIGAYAFSGCSALTNLELSEGVTSIGDAAFYNCSKLTNFEIPDSLISIGSYAFYGCSGLTSLEIPNTVTSIGLYTFSGCTGLTSIVVPDNLDLELVGFDSFYKISYVLNGGEFTDGYCNIYSSKADYVLSIPEKKGATFVGWYSDSKYKTKVTSIKKGTTGNKKFYAKWEATKYSIQYNLNGGTNNSKNVTSFSSDAKDITLLNPTRTAATFSGWYSDPECTLGNKVTVIPAGTNQNVTVYAKWDLIDYTINYVLNGGENSENNPSIYTVETVYTLENPSKTGYTFLGWYTDSKFKTKFTKFSKNYGNKTLYAKWTLTSYPIKYNLNGGVNNSKNATSFNINSKDITLLNPTKTGATFLGWYSDPECTDGNEVTKILSGTHETINVYAKWNLYDYTVNYVLNGGINSENNPDIYTVDTVYTLEPATKTGYTFLGWYSDSKFKTKFTKFSKNTGNKTLYAKWALTKYAIKYNLNGGTNNKKNVTSFYITSKDITLLNPTKVGARFLGWYSDPECTDGNEVIKVLSGTHETVNVYAKWELIDYTVNYVLNGGENSESNPSIYTVETVYTLEPATREGYTFVGWYTTNKYKTKFSKFSKSYGNKTLYAKWTPYTYTVRFNANTGSGKMKDLKLTYDKFTALTSNAFSKKGYTFIGWATEPNGEVVYTNKAKVSNLTNVKGGIVNLFAVWEKTEYTITYKNISIEEVEELGLPTSYYIDSPTITFDSISRIGYTFNGYYADSKYKTKLLTIKTGSTGNKVVYTKWAPYKYQLHFNANSGTGTMKNQVVSYGTATSITNLYKKTGYKLVGWSLNPEPVDSSEIFTKAYNLTPINGGVVEVYAIWERIEYQIKYVNLTATEVETLGLPTSYNVESEQITIPNPTRTGKTFVGYYADKKYKTKAKTLIPKGSTGDRTLYVRWK